MVQSKLVRAFNDNRIRYIRHMMNRGVSRVRNTGIKDAASDKYIAFLDDDDEWLPQYLDIMINVMDRERKDFAFCPFYQIDPDTGVVLNIRKQQKKQRKKGSSIGFPSGWVLRKKVFEKAGMFDEGTNCLHDVEMSFRILRHYKAIYVDKPLVKWYCTAGSVSSDIRGQRRGIKILLDRYSEIMNSAELADWQIALADSYFAEEIFKSGRQNLIGAMRTNPFSLKISLLFLASFLGYRLYFNLGRILNLNVTKIIGRIKKFVKG